MARSFWTKRRVEQIIALAKALTPYSVSIMIHLEPVEYEKVAAMKLFPIIDYQKHLVGRTLRLSKDSSIVVFRRGEVI
jgi:hypothetical protein